MKLLEKKDKNERLKNETYILTKRDPKTLKKIFLRQNIYKNFIQLIYLSKAHT